MSLTNPDLRTNRCIFTTEMPASIKSSRQMRSVAEGDIATAFYMHDMPCRETERELLTVVPLVSSLPEPL